MSILSFAEDDLFVIRVIKSMTTNPDNRWTNTYEFQASVAGDEGDLLTLANKVVLFEKEIHLITTNFEYVVVSTWAPDSVPYDPDNFLSSSLTAVGVRGTGSPPIGLNQTYSVARDCASGRKGHIFFRGCLTESDVEAPAGKSVLTDRPGMQTALEDALDESTLNTYIGPDASGGFRMVLVNADGDKVRTVIQLRAQGVSQVPQDHAWFNRSSITVP